MYKSTLFIGLPGSGKTSFISENINDCQIVNADDIKETHPDWDLSNPEEVHAWSVIEAEKLMNEYSDSGIDICMDSGGVNNRYSLRIINMLKSKGYYVRIIHMDTPLEVCLERNRIRERRVPEDDIIRKSKMINDCVEKQKLIADEYVKIEFIQRCQPATLRNARDSNIK